MENSDTLTIIRNEYILGLDTTVLKDPRLSWQAKGVHTYLMQSPKGQKILLADLQNHSRNGRDACRSALKELIETGYVERLGLKNELGHFKGYEYRVYENLQNQAAQTQPRPIYSPKPEIGFSDYGFSETVFSNFGETENGFTEDSAKISQNLESSHLYTENLTEAEEPEVGKSDAGKQDNGLEKNILVEKHPEDEEPVFGKSDAGKHIFRSEKPIFTEDEEPVFGKPDAGKPAFRKEIKPEPKTEPTHIPFTPSELKNPAIFTQSPTQTPKTFNYSLDILGRAKEKFLMAAAKWFNPETRPNIHTAKEHKGLRLLLDKICQLKSLPQPETETESVVGHLETFLGKCQYVLAEDLEFRSNFMPAWIGEHFDELCQKLVDWNKNNTPETNFSNQASLQKKVKLADGTIEISPVSEAEELAYRRRQYASHHTHSNNGEVERGMAAHRLLSKIHPDEFIQNLPDEAGDWQAVLGLIHDHATRYGKKYDDVARSYIEARAQRWKTFEDANIAEAIFCVRYRIIDRELFATICRKLELAIYHQKYKSLENKGMSRPQIIATIGNNPDWISETQAKQILVWYLLRADQKQKLPAACLEILDYYFSPIDFSRPQEVAPLYNKSLEKNAPVEEEKQKKSRKK